MNKQTLVIFVFSLSVLLSSCGKDDEPKVVVPSPIVGVKEYSFSILASAGATTTLEKDINLTDYTELGIYPSYVYQGTLKTNSSIEISGITSGQSIELKDVTIQLKNNASIKYVLGTVTANTTLNSLADLNFMQLVVNDLVKNKSVVLQLKFTTTNKIETEVKVSFKTNITFYLK